MILLHNGQSLAFVWQPSGYLRKNNILQIVVIAQWPYVMEFIPCRNVPIFVYGFLWDV